MPNVLIAKDPLTVHTSERVVLIVHPHKARVDVLKVLRVRDADLVLAADVLEVVDLRGHVEPVLDDHHVVLHDVQRALWGDGRQTPELRVGQVRVVRERDDALV